MWCLQTKDTKEFETKIANLVCWGLIWWVIYLVGSRLQKEKRRLTDGLNFFNLQKWKIRVDSTSINLNIVMKRTCKKDKDKLLIARKVS